ncbi:hypothetical protein M595_1351 [Lyngbya aestuarii BL J]|uniref:Uncharacterized protein n=1 Tax=Lyngbya aestuarii BL J TaxID=1348334 RepID=U7QQ73_9CYAN|nr:hypothetical protein M595_1351 [Lyngbya aestuarii BL J]
MGASSSESTGTSESSSMSSIPPPKPSEFPPPKEFPPPSVGLPPKGLSSGSRSPKMSPRSSISPTPINGSNGV